jgi:hypothetical protein
MKTNNVEDFIDHMNEWSRMIENPTIFVEEYRAKSSVSWERLKYFFQDDCTTAGFLLSISRAYKTQHVATTVAYAWLKFPLLSEEEAISRSFLELLLPYFPATDGISKNIGTLRRNVHQQIDKLKAGMKKQG